MSSSVSSPTELTHPIIGAVHGRRVGQVLQFLGIKYASLDHWLDNPQLCTYDGSGIDAERHGPQAISDPSGVDQEMVAIQKALPKPDFPGMSGTDCLTLNISIPEEAHRSAKLPVLVYIHGGGFTVGSNWWPQYDMKRIVQLSTELGQPIVAININYRLGAAGFLASEELSQAGFETNRGLRDQRVALQWITKYISGFGGDPGRVTVCGESAGGLSATRLLYADDALVSRVVVLGGAPPSMSPLSRPLAEANYEALVEALGYGDLSSTERIKVLQRTSIADLQRNLSPSLPFLPVLDEALVPYHETFSFMQSKDYIFKAKSCKAAMVVFSPLDASIFAFMGLFSQRQAIASAFTDWVSSSLHDHDGAAARLLQCYGITPDIDDQVALLRLLQFGSDIGHQAAARTLAASFPGDAFVMEFAEPNPWDGPFKGYSTHILDIAFLLQNYNDSLDETQKAAARQFAKNVIEFAHGQKPWEPFSPSRGFSRLNGGQQQYLGGEEAVTGRFKELLDIGHVIGLDTLMGLWMGFMFGG
ncbi:Alpha/Beta hydrolase protein [Dactylonectria macrodidyma]|uniref:Carboxylic ester hydrolase n=1 Tax=Dactylonectria macrodidyma TaxID=307937 RepID=A0A9P9EB07_9HYPO|nr:Alpha/Beta hydrolase protein [Dactylonectria macrodidyma]